MRFLVLILMATAILAAEDPRHAIAVLEPTDGNDTHGLVTFTQMDDGVRIAGRIEGLDSGSSQGFHIHEYGDISASDGTAAGGHYNPAGHDHALPTSDHRHAGDLGNITADDDGVAEFAMTVTNISLADEHPILGRAVIVHAKADDGGQPTGNAGARIAQGVIGIDASDSE